jgi:glyoxylase-like metal-dependent hydrolase (beta-lactamase superfamily II)
MSLEDEFSDVIAKAMRGLELDSSALASSCGISAERVEALLQGNMDQDAIASICPVLGLDAAALLNLPNYLPQEIHLAGIRKIELPFGQWKVNAWEIQHDGTQLLFDAGFGELDILDEVSSSSLDALLITHAHPDHIGGVKALSEKGVRGISEQEALLQGTLDFGSIHIEVVDLSGHCSPAVGYLIHGLARQVFIVGDAIFAGSMGGCKTRAAYELAGLTLKKACAKADPDCIILPGHGPATTLAEELRHNPFQDRFHAARSPSV